MKFLKLILFVFAIGFSTNSNALITMINAPSCGKWVTEHAEQPLPLEAIYDEYWLVAYLSGLASGLNKDFLNNQDPSSLILWMHNYCKNSPLDYVSSGAHELSDELTKRMKK